MAPLGMVSMLGLFSSPEVGIISLIVFLVLSITLVALCVRCQRSSGNAYDVNGITIEGGGGGGGTKGNAGTNSNMPTDPGTGTSSNWRDHHLPPSTLDRSAVVNQS